METRSISAEALARQLNGGVVTVIDVRDPEEFLSGHIRGSLNVPLAEITASGLPSGPLVVGWSARAADGAPGPWSVCRRRGIPSQ